MSSDLRLKHFIIKVSIFLVCIVICKLLGTGIQLVPFFLKKKIIFFD